VRTRGPGGESSLTLSGRPTAGCLAHQSEAPPGRSKRRDSLEQCPITKVKGGVRGGRARARGAILGRGVPKWWKAPRLVGSRCPSRGDGGSESRPVRVRRKGVSSPSATASRRPGCSGATTRRGARLRASPSLARSRPAPSNSGSPGKQARLVMKCVDTRIHARTGKGTAVAFSDDDRTLVGCARAS
jgi:hypothetical protein